MMGIPPVYRAGAVFIGAAIVFSAAYSAFPAEASETDTRTVEWLMTNTSEPTNVTAEWPQTILGLTDCGWIQTDSYRYGTAEDIAAVDAILADGILTKGEDHAVIESWSFRLIPCPSPRIVAAVDQVDSKSSAAELAATGFELWLLIPASLLLFLGVCALVAVRRRSPQ